MGDDITALEQLGMTAWLDKPPGGLQVARAIAGRAGPRALSTKPDIGSLRSR